MGTNYHEYCCKQALSRHTSQFWNYDLNIYRGCSHGCLYCYALYSHEYLGHGDFYHDVYVKTNIVERLEYALSSRSWQREPINLGGVTDSYQPIEAHYQFMPDILKLLIRYQTPIILSTKSDLILRDYDLIAKLASITYVNIAATVTTVDQDLQKVLEPGAVSPNRRIAMLEAFSKTKAKTGMHIMPIIPHLNDSRENVTALFSAAKQAKVDYVLPACLYLRGRTRGAFFAACQQHYPDLYSQIAQEYQKGRLSPAYKEQLYGWLRPLMRSYGLSSNYLPPQFPGKTKPEQLTFL